MSDLTKTASAWFARNRAASFAERERDAFESWLAEDVEHRIAYADAERAWEVAQAALDDPRLAALRESIGREPPPQARVRLAVAAGVALSLLGGGGLLAVQQLSGPKPLATQSFRTEVGQRSTVTLPDGSVVTLNTDTTVRTRADGERRLVYLDRGQAYFRVAQDRRHPFVVTAAGRTVTALGTAFDVRVDGGQLKVVLVEGKVRVEGPPATAARGAGVQAADAKRAADVQATEMLAGSQLIAPDNSEWRLTAANTARETSWVSGQIIFDDEPLGAVVAELNRYSQQKMVIHDPTLAAKPISGAFKPGDVRGFARSLEAYRYAYVASENDGALHFAPLKPEKKS
ncbi:MAG TPA: FecR domain-containing protein [Caulobacteraceae bacterium]|nr:FecR domain-containing protein [Caulobacteraceae bacterium]